VTIGSNPWADPATATEPGAVYSGPPATVRPVLGPGYGAPGFGPPPGHGYPPVYGYARPRTAGSPGTRRSGAPRRAPAGPAR
jgi:hypothetical protein